MTSTSPRPGRVWSWGPPGAFEAVPRVTASPPGLPPGVREDIAEGIGVARVQANAMEAENPTAARDPRQDRRLARDVSLAGDVHDYVRSDARCLTLRVDFSHRVHLRPAHHRAPARSPSKGPSLTSAVANSKTRRTVAFSRPSRSQSGARTWPTGRPASSQPYFTVWMNLPRSASEASGMSRSMAEREPAKSPRSRASRTATHCLGTQLPMPAIQLRTPQAANSNA